MWTEQLITLYCTVYRYYDSGISAQVQRFSNNFRPQFTDEEAITVFLWGILQRRFEVKAIYQYTQMHLLDWFPRLPSYDTSISHLRQPIEGFFNWLHEKTGIQTASKVRSLKGLLLHIFARLSAALLSLSFSFYS